MYCRGLRIASLPPPFYLWRYRFLTQVLSLHLRTGAFSIFTLSIARTTGDGGASLLGGTCFPSVCLRPGSFPGVHATCPRREISRNRDSPDMWQKSVGITNSPLVFPNVSCLGEYYTQSKIYPLFLPILSLLFPPGG